jgi:hypothetical protein
MAKTLYNVSTQTYCRTAFSAPHFRWLLIMFQFMQAKTKERMFVCVCSERLVFQQN